MYILIQWVKVTKGRGLNLHNITLQILSCRNVTQTSEEMSLCFVFVCNMSRRRKVLSRKNGGRWRKKAIRTVWKRMKTTQPAQVWLHIMIIPLACQGASACVLFLYKTVHEINTFMATRLQTSFSHYLFFLSISHFLTISCFLIAFPIACKLKKKYCF